MAACHPKGRLLREHTCAVGHTAFVVRVKSQGDTLPTQVSLRDAPVGPGGSRDLQPQLQGRQRSFAALLLAKWLTGAVIAARCI